LFLQEELERGMVGCQDDCANKLLMIECGKDCPLELNCSNKRFVNQLDQLEDPE
jgi:histone-lysine N-methyltransferase SETD2